MTPTTLPPTLLPRARGLTDALLAPSGPPPPPEFVADLARSLRDGLVEATAGYDGPPLRVDAFSVRTLGQPPRVRGMAGDDAFRWTPCRARRAVGVSAAARVVKGRARSPAQGVELALADMVEDARSGSARPRSLASWLGSVPEPVLAAVRAEATAFATHLVSAVEWPRVRAVEVGGPDRWWDLGSRPSVGLRGRADARTATTCAGREASGGQALSGGPPRPARQSLLTLVAGWPGPGSRAELGLAALVEVLRRPDAPTPARVVGWWPECGRALVLDVDVELLASTAAATLATVRVMARRHSLRLVRER